MQWSREQVVIRIHTGSVNSVSFSPDGKRIASVSHDCLVRLWDAATGDPIGYPLELHNHSANSVVFSPNGIRIASGSLNSIQIWDTETGNPMGEPLQGYSALPISLAFSPDGKMIVSGFEDFKSDSVWIWDVETKRPIGKGNAWAVQSVAFSPDGKKVVSGSLTHSVQIWLIETGDPLSNTPISLF